MTGFGMPGVWTWNFGDDFAHLYLDSIATESQRRSAAATKPSAMARPRRCCRTSPSDETEPRVVPALAAAADAVPLVGARQSQLHRDRGAGRTRRGCPCSRMRCCRTSTRRDCTPGSKGLEQPPYAFVIPADQGDPTRVAQLVARLLASGIEVSRAQRPLTLNEGTIPPGPTSCVWTSPTATTRWIC